jgi:hypothetical protein
MAQNKHHSNFWLTQHVAAYTTTIALATMVWAWDGNRPLAVLFIFLNGVLHWLTDYVTSRYNARMWAAHRVHDFFVGVGLDQMIHLYTLVLTAWWLL